MGKRKKIVFLINSLTSGGAERVMTTLLEHSTAEREEFDIVLALLDDVARAYAPADWLKVRQFDCKLSLWRSILAVRALFREERPDATLSFLVRANIANVLASMERGIPCIISERINNSAHLERNLGGAAARSLIRFCYPRAARVIAVSSGVEEDLRAHFAVPGEKIVTIDNPVDIEAIRAQALQAPPIATDGPFILAVGRLVKPKNFALLIEAYAAAHVGAKLVIIGEGPERDALLRQIDELGLAERVSLPGHVRNPYPLMGRAQLYVSPSNAEGFPNALVEAMALGAPVVSTNCPSGPAEILAEAKREEVDGLRFAKHGILVPPGSQDCLVAALQAMEDADLRRAYGEKAKLRAADFSVEKAKDKYWGIVRAQLSANENEPAEESSVYAAQQRP
jgi:N-acetylgalactosamine-N,N'-diacetylbacillosaminyl-diphospho-undecaprenol 4-alpha-N-acetylgalactosaminyltransferase